MSSRPVRVAVIDSGVSIGHQHIRTIAGGVTIGPTGAISQDYFDRLGHGTAVTAAIQERAPDADILVVKVFDWELAAPVETLVHAIDWAAGQHVDLINLSLGTRQPDHANRLRQATRDATRAGTLVVAARGPDGVDYLPGSLGGVVPVELDWDCPRLAVAVDDDCDGPPRCRASGYPRPTPGLDVGEELRGLSLAVANVTGLLARDLPANGRASVTTAIGALRQVQRDYRYSSRSPRVPRP